jgi:hypothetical protein
MRYLVRLQVWCWETRVLARNEAGNGAAVAAGGGALAGGGFLAWFLNHVHVIHL